MVGNKIRQLREDRGILLRELAASIHIDPALLSKMERGERLFKTENIIALAKTLNISYKELQTAWLADKILKTIKDQDNKKEALELALNTLR